jgi:anti-anti-sigma regulatory factor
MHEHDVEGFRLLNVYLKGGTLHATLACPRLVGPEYAEALEEDLGRLHSLGSGTVWLDLRGVAFVDNRFAGLIIGLWCSLAAAGRRLTVQARPPLANVFRVTKLDQLFEMINGPDSTAQADPA